MAFITLFIILMPIEKRIQHGADCGFLRDAILIKQFLKFRSTAGIEIIVIQVMCMKW